MSRSDIPLEEFLFLPPELQIEILNQSDFNLDQLRMLYRQVEHPYVRNHIKQLGEDFMRNAPAMDLFDTGDYATLEWRKLQNIPLAEDDKIFDLIIRLMYTGNVEALEWIYQTNGHPSNSDWLGENLFYFMDYQIENALMEGQVQVAQWLSEKQFMKNDSDSDSDDKLMWWLM